MAQKDNYQFKIRKVDDYTFWEDIPVHATVKALTEKGASKHARTLSNLPDVFEVRYNAVGSLQGYYVAGSPENRRKHLRVNNAA